METVCPGLSPGPVQDDETLARFVPSENYYDTETKRVLPNLFEAASQNGMSVTRIEKAGVEQLAKQQADSKYHGYVNAKASDVRSIFHGILDAEANKVIRQKRAFAIYDTALPENVLHADICQTVMNPGAIGIKLRVTLRDAFSSDIKNYSLPQA
jgi:hypothetical protein